MDDVIFAHKPRLFDVAAQLKRSAHAALGLAAGQRTHGTTYTFRAFKVTSHVATPGSESAVQFMTALFDFIVGVLAHLKQEAFGKGKLLN